MFCEGKLIWKMLSRNPKNFDKTGCNHHCPLWHAHRHWGIGIPSDLQSRPEQSHHLPGAWLPDDYRQPIGFTTGIPPSSLQKRRLFSLFMIMISDYCKKVWYLTKSFPLAAEFIYFATSAECAGTINWPTVVKGSTNLVFNKSLSLFNSVWWLVNRKKKLLTCLTS